MLTIEQASREFGLAVSTIYCQIGDRALTRHVASGGRPRVFLDRQELLRLVKPQPGKPRKVAR